MKFKSLLIIIVFSFFIFPLNILALNKAVVDITEMDIAALSEALSLKLITSEELVNLYLDRINEYDDNYKAIINLNEKASETAKALDQERAEGKVRSVLHGIPILVKDNIDVYGLPTTAGAKALKDNYPNQNAFVIQKLIDAGAIILGKTNMSEFAFYASSSNSSYGRVSNAYNLDYSSYGSSGGSAVAVAASLSAAAIGSDTNCSVRVPASANNVVGLRPTLGILSRTGVLPYDVERDTVGPLTKTVTDAMLLMNIMNGYDETDGKSTKGDPLTYTTTKESLTGVVIGVPTDFMTGSNNNGLIQNKATYSEITKLMESALEKLQANGAKIVYLDDYYTGKTSAWYQNSVSGYTFCDGFNNYIKGTTGKIRSFSALVNANEKITPLGGYLSDCNAGRSKDGINNMKSNYRDYIKKIMDNDHIDVIAYPATKNKLLKHNSTDIYNVSVHASSTINYPAIALPLGFDKDDLPYGIELMTYNNNEQTLFDIAALYEKINGNTKTPSIAPALYTIDEEVTKLVANYREAYNSKSMKNWLTEAESYFRSYSENENVINDATALNSSYKIADIKTTVLTGSFKIIKTVVLVIILLIVILLIRKFIRRTIRRIKRGKKLKNKR